MNFQEIILEKKEAVAWITLNRPEQNNALNPPLVKEILEAVREVSTDQESRVIVIYGGPGKTFCSGANVARMMQSEMPILNRREFPGLFVEILKLLRRIDKPTIAAVNGHAMGGGAGLAMACDFVIMAEEAKIGFPEITVGFIPAIVLVNLIRMLPWRTVVELVYTGKMLTAPEAKEIGLINDYCAKEQLLDKVQELAGNLAGRSPTAVRLIKELMRSIECTAFDQALDNARDINVLSQLTDDFKEGVSAFLEKRSPQWTGS